MYVVSDNTFFYIWIYFIAIFLFISAYFWLTEFNYFQGYIYNYKFLACILKPVSFIIFIHFNRLIHDKHNKFFLYGLIEA